MLSFRRRPCALFSWTGALHREGDRTGEGAGESREKAGSGSFDGSGLEVSIRFLRAQERPRQSGV